MDNEFQFYQVRFKRHRLLCNVENMVRFNSIKYDLNRFKNALQIVLLLFQFYQVRFKLDLLHSPHSPYQRFNSIKYDLNKLSWWNSKSPSKKFQFYQVRFKPKVSSMGAPYPPKFQFYQVRFKRWTYSRCWSDYWVSILSSTI